MESNKVIKYIGYVIFTILFILISFFGLGPVLMADGQTGERILTLIIVLIIYVIWFFALSYFIKKMNKR